MSNKINKTVKILQEGGVIAYPTEGVFGFGCDPFNETAVTRLLKIKQRDVKKGLILIAANWDQVKTLIKIDLAKYKLLKQNNKKPITWVFPATKKAPAWITGEFNTVAIRVTLHPIAKELCQRFGGPIVSTSANLIGKKPLRDAKQVAKQFLSEVDLIISEKVGALKKPTEIRDITTGKVIRI